MKSPLYLTVHISFPQDFMYATPINCINAALAKVKTVEGHKNRFTIITFNKSYRSV